MRSRVIAAAVAAVALFAVTAPQASAYDAATERATATAPANSVDTAAIQNGAVTYPKLAVNSVASSRLMNGSVAWEDMAVDSVSGYLVRNGTIAEPDLSADVVEKLNAAGPAGPVGPEGPKGEKGDPASDVKGTTTVKAAYNNVVVENIGGKFLERKTDLGEFTLPAGTWVINTSAKFTRITEDTTDPLYQTRPQLSVRAFHTEANPFGQDFGTVMNTIAPYATADMFGSDSKRVELTEETTFKVAAFGYQDNRGSDDSGKIKLLNATIFVTAG